MTSGSFSGSIRDPEIPADIQVCINNAVASRVPDRKLTVADVERLWKQDRLQIRIVKQCGQRMIHWYEGVRT